MIAFRQLLPLLVLLPAGCGGGPSLGVVTGTVTVNGRPVTQGTIMFVPAEGKAAVGTIGPDGRYTLTTFQPGDGALVGSHRVTILATHVTPATYSPATLQDELAQANREGGNRYLVPGKVIWLVPQRYSQLETTPLTVEVTAEAQTHDFHVPQD